MGNFALSIQEVHKLLKEILDIIDDVASKNDCVYYLHAGTALGTVRHMDLIPWDDDADVIIPINCYERLISALQNSDLGKFEVIYRTPKCTRMQAKIVLKGQNEDLICVDLFPMIGTGNTYEEQVKLDKISSKIRRYYKYKHELAISTSTNIFKSITKRIVVVLMNIWASDEKLYRRFDEEVLYRYDFDNAEFVTQPCGKYGMKNVLRKEVYGKSVSRPLGKKLYPTPNEIEEYLKHYYGDYMKTPSEESKNKSINKQRLYIGNEKEYLSCIQ